MSSDAAAAPAKEPGRIMKPMDIPIYGRARGTKEHAGRPAAGPGELQEPGYLQQGFKEVRLLFASALEPFKYEKRDESVVQLKI